MRVDTCFFQFDCLIEVQRFCKKKTIFIFWLCPVVPVQIRSTKYIFFQVFTLIIFALKDAPPDICVLRYYFQIIL